MHSHWIEQSAWTVGDLIAALQKFPAEAPVYLAVPAGSEEVLAVATDSFSDAVTLHGRV